MALQKEQGLRYLMAGYTLSSIDNIEAFSNAIRLNVKSKVRVEKY